MEPCARSTRQCPCRRAAACGLRLVLWALAVLTLTAVARACGWQLLAGDSGVAGVLAHAWSGVQCALWIADACALVACGIGLHKMRVMPVALLHGLATLALIAVVLELGVAVLSFPTRDPQQLVVAVAADRDVHWLFPAHALSWLVRVHQVAHAVLWIGVALYAVALIDRRRRMPGQGIAALLVGLAVIHAGSLVSGRVAVMAAMYGLLLVLAKMCHIIARALRDDPAPAVAIARFTRATPERDRDAT